jgi:opacity protein-like surface antigen
MPRGVLATTALLLTALALASPLRAQSAGRGFLFKTPTGSFTLRGGFAHANAGSDIFSDATSRFTIDKGDFSGFTVGADLALRVAPRFDVVLGGGYAGVKAPSESRDFVENDLPIRQTTTFKRIPFTASVKAYLTPRGRSIGRFAWVPAKYALYAGGGVGLMRYDFEQSGDFVDDQTLVIHTDRFRSSGWTPEAHGMAGIEFSLSPRFALTGEGRYTWAKADPSRDFANFSRIDLSGFAATAGISVRF